MSAPVRVKLSGETAPEAPSWWRELVLPALLTALQDIAGALDRGLTRRENMVGDWDELDFTTGATAYQTVVPRKHRMAERPKHVWVSQLQRYDEAELSAAWSWTWKLNQRNEIELKFQGLSNSTRYLARIVYE